MKHLPFVVPFVATALMALLISCGNDEYSKRKARIPFEAPTEVGTSGGESKRWLAGDHHIHSRYSVGWDYSTTPPSPILGVDGKYSGALNAQMAHKHGLDWMVITDHGGPNHSRVNLEQAYPDLVASRQVVPEVLQFYGMEFDTPAAQHSSLIIPYSSAEAEQLFQIERDFNREEELYGSAERDSEEDMLAALLAMQMFNPAPILMANHPSRSAYALGDYSTITPRELRGWNDIAPGVAVGMEAAPGHQAASINTDGSLKSFGKRGGYNSYPTMGGYDQMTAQLGGFWDSMLAEGRHWWVTANSDSHVHYTEGGRDFWPGEYTKTYIYADKSYASILEGLREGRVFVVTGDLIDDLGFTLINRSHQLSSNNSGVSRTAITGETLAIAPGDTIQIKVRVHDPNTKNVHGDNPKLARIDIIQGDAFTEPADPSTNVNANVAVIERFYIDEMQHKQGIISLSLKMSDVQKSGYIRLRGTNNRNELEPEPDAPGENPWLDLWFYSNPIFYQVTGS